jgi:tetratricopeptide (TPR) repeat protein
MGPEGAAAAWAAAQEAKRLAPHASPADATTSTRSRCATSRIPRIARPRSARRSTKPSRTRCAASAEASERRRRRGDLRRVAADLSPWNYWQDDGSPRAFTNEAEAALKAALALNPDHTGALHYTIHVYERFEPEKAEPAADRLEVQAPDAGHLVHMPAHIYYRVGRYKDSADVNEAAAAADVAYFSWCRRRLAALYYTHNRLPVGVGDDRRPQRRGDDAARRIVAQVPTDQLDLPVPRDFW